MLASVPFYHSYGFVVFCFRSFSIPGTVVTIPKWDATLVLRLIPKLKITVVPLVPSMILQLVTHPEWETTDTSTVEHTASGAAFLPPELKAKFLSKFDSNLTHGYGSSESVRGLTSFFLLLLWRDLHLTVIPPPRLSRSPRRYERMPSLDTNRSMGRSASSCPVHRLGSSVKTVRTVRSEKPAKFGPRATPSLQATSVTKRRPRRRSPRTGGSRPVIFSPSTRKEISCKIPLSLSTYLVFVILTQLNI